MFVSHARTPRPPRHESRGVAGEWARMGVARLLRIVAAALCAVLFVIACRAGARAAGKLCTPNGALPYDRPIGLTMQELDAPDFDLVKYRGRGVVLNIFASWCGPCREEMPALLAAAKHYAPLGVSVVLVDFHEPDNTIRRFRSKEGITLPIAMDRGGGFTQALEMGPTSKHLLFPSTLFINAAGRLTCFVQDSMDSDEWQREIEKIVPSPAPSPEASPSPTPAASRSPRSTRGLLR